MNKFNIAKIKQQLKARKFIIGQSFCALLREAEGLIFGIIILLRPFLLVQAQATALKISAWINSFPKPERTKTPSGDFFQASGLRLNEQERAQKEKSNATKSLKASGEGRRKISIWMI